LILSWGGTVNQGPNETLETLSRSGSGRPQEVSWKRAY
jgi:hypothetical protein